MDLKLTVSYYQRAQEIVEQLEAALEEFRSVEEVLSSNGVAE